MALTVATAGTGVARTSHYVTPTGASAPIQTLLLEPQRTNLLVRSEDFSTTWAITASSVVTNATTAPDGTVTADKLQTNTTSAEHSVTQNITWTNGTTYGVSCYFKAAEIGYGFITLPTVPFSTIRRNYINLSTGAVTLAASTFGAAEALSNGWWRFTVWATATGSTLSTSVRIGLTTSDTTTTTTGSNTTDGIYIWGAQIEAGVPSSYIKTEGTTVTRNADSLYFPFTVPPQAMTVYVRGVNVGAYQSQTNAARVLHIGDINTGTDPRFSLVRNAGASQVQTLYDDGVTLRSGNATPSPTPVLRDLIEHRGVLSSSWVPSSGISVNGGVEQTGTTTASGPATAWANPRLYIAGHADHDQFAYTHVIVAAGEQTMATMRSLAGVG
jgi:hypothetical protein